MIPPSIIAGLSGEGGWRVRGFGFIGDVAFWLEGSSCAESGLTSVGCVGVSLIIGVQSAAGFGLA